MTKRFLFFALVAVFAGGAIAQAATTPTAHKVSVKLVIRVLTSDANGATFTGTASSKATGPGAVVVKATGGASAATNTIAGTGFFRAGSVTIKGSITTTPRADGSGFDYAGTAKAVGGTALYKGAKGNLKLVGSASASDPAFQTYTVTGTLKY